MITTNAIQRTFFIRFGKSTGTAFTIDSDSKQYLVTARHVVEGIRPRDVVGVFHDREWKDLEVRVVGIGGGESDIAVMAASHLLSGNLPLEPTTEGLTYGQQLYFLGFPFGWDGGAEHLSNGYPLPFVKSGVLSALIPGVPTKIYMDAHGNRGFSGGPVIFAPDGHLPGTNQKLKVAGVVVNYPTPRIEPAITPDGEQVFDQNNNPIGLLENPGFVVALDIKHALELISRNPIGILSPAV